MYARNFVCFGELICFNRHADLLLCMIHYHGGKIILFLRLDDEYLEVPQSTEVDEGAVVTLRCVHRFGWSYTWRSNRRYITTTDSKVS